MFNTMYVVWQPEVHGFHSFTSLKKGKTKDNESSSTYGVKKGRGVSASFSERSPARQHGAPAPCIIICKLYNEQTE